MTTNAYRAALNETAFNPKASQVLCTCHHDHCLVYWLIKRCDCSLVQLFISATATNSQSVCCTSKQNFQNFQNFSTLNASGTTYEYEDEVGLQLACILLQVGNPPLVGFVPLC